MPHVLDEGDKCICQEDEWFNAFGERSVALHKGMRLDVVNTINVGGIRFLEFKGHKGLFFMAAGFVPLRDLN